MLQVLFSAVLWLFVGSVIMLTVNELLPGGVSKWAFVKGMVIWPAYVFRYGAELIRLLWVQ